MTSFEKVLLAAVSPYSLHQERKLQNAPDLRESVSGCQTFVGIYKSIAAFYGVGDQHRLALVVTSSPSNIYIPMSRC